MISILPCCLFAAVNTLPGPALEPSPAMTAASVTEMSMRDETSPLTSRYGNEPGQEGDLYSLPGEELKPVVVLLHGGFWKMPYGRDQLDEIAAALSEQGYAVWNLGYRRLGAPGVGWQEISGDVVAGIEHLAQLPAELDLDRVILVGHSAGGQLALWAAGERGRLQAAGIEIRAVVGLAAVSDLEEAARLGLGGNVMNTLLPHAPSPYVGVSPVQRLPLGVPQVLLHGDADTAVPIAMSQRYVEVAKVAGDAAVLRALPGIGHMDFLDTGGSAYTRVCEAVAELVAVTRVSVQQGAT